jgi:hypothetical protein
VTRAETTERKPNRLINQKSPYLLQHAHNPVDWFPWGREAFQKARRQNKPIFLSIGYSTCHWCHVMERESFENEAIAELMNRHFIAIKVDREERPDIDHIYMTATQAMTGGGGWPMSVWLTPDLKPFYCGTYFPPATFRQLLERIHEVWQSNPTGIVAQAAQITASLDAHLSGRHAAPSRPPDAAPLLAGLESFRQAYDPLHGGFGGAPKFPRPAVMSFLFRAGGKDMALHTLRKMAEGGIFDQLGGGFHRYSVDERWHVPHFEKMLYDQAQLIASYSEAHQITGDPFFADIASRTADYVLRDMTSPDGAFYSAEDADSEGVEGKFYVWTRAELEAVLGDKADAFCRAHGDHILTGNIGTERAALLAARSKRVRPHRDEKILTGWNGLMISALCKAGRASDLSTARRAAQFLLAHRYRDGRLWRTETVPGMLDDYSNFATGLLDLHEADFNPRWLEKSVEITGAMLNLFYDREHGGFFQTDGADPSVIIRAKDNYDGAEPSGNAAATLLLLRLATFTDRADFRQAAEKTLAAFGDVMNRAPHAVPQMLCALDWQLRGPTEIIVTGKLGAPDTQALLAAARSRYVPNRALIFKPKPGKAAAQVCVNRVCRLPVSEPEQLKKSLEPAPPAQ